MATPTTPTKTTAYTSDRPQSTQTTGAPRPASTGRPRKISEYGRQLAEKQKARREYGLREAQFYRYFLKASKSPVTTGQALFTLLELRLDNILFRTGMAKTRRMGRQLVGHGLVLVNGKRLNMPSYAVKEGDTISLKKDDHFPHDKEALIPDWLSYNSKTKTAKVERLPKADDLVTDINSQLIIEYYSR